LWIDRRRVDDEIGPARFLFVGHLAPRIDSSFACVIPGRASTRAR
jgi:hypothetical protein